MSYIERAPVVGDWVAYFPNNCEEPERFGRVVELKPWGGFRKGRNESGEYVCDGYSARLKPGEHVWVETDRAYVEWQETFEHEYGPRRPTFVDIRTLRVIDKEQVPHVCDPRPKMVWRNGDWHFDPPHCSCQDQKAASIARLWIGRVYKAPDPPVPAFRLEEV